MKRWQDLVMFGGVMLVAAIAMFFLVFTFVGGRGREASRDADRQAILREMDMHRCRSEQLLRDLYAVHRIPVPAYPDGVDPPPNCAVVSARTEEVAP